MSEATELLGKFVSENRQEVLSKFNAVLKEYSLSTSLTVVEAKISYSENPSGVSEKSNVIYHGTHEGEEVIVIAK